MGIFDKTDQKTKQQTSSTVIADGVIIKGDIESSGSVFINGKFEGRAIVGETLTIGQEGHFIGDITCKNLIVNGLVDGIANAQDISILKIGKIYGNIQYDNLEIDKNGTFEGQGRKNNSNFESKYKSIAYTQKKLDDIVIDTE